jgi:hypothetical protein
MVVDEKFYQPRIPVAVVAIGEASEAFLVRSILEGLGATVLLHLIGTPEDFLKVIEQGENAPRYVVICGHGNENGFIFGAYGGTIDTSALQQGAMPPSSIAERVDLPRKFVVSTACGTGSKAFGEAFRKGGVAAYIAPNGYPEGADAGLFIHLLFDQILRKRTSPDSALRHVREYDAEFGMFTLFSVS